MKLKNSKQNGFTIIELLVAVVVLSIGLLGLAGLQAVSLKNNSSVINRTNATYLAYSIIDRIRTNPSASYAVTESSIPPQQNCLIQTCSTDEMINYDIAFWKCSIGSYDTSTICQQLSISGSLPEGLGSIDVDNNTYTVTISWTDDRSDVRDSMSIVAEL